MGKVYGRRMFEALIRCGEGEADALAEDRYEITDAGVFLKRLDKDERRVLAPTEVAALEDHPTGNYDAPALTFPFGLADLVAFERVASVIAERWIGCDDERMTDQLPGEARGLADALLDVLEDAPIEEAEGRLRGGNDTLLVAPGRIANAPSVELPEPAVPSSERSEASRVRWQFEKPRRWDAFTRELVRYLETADKTAPRPAASDMLLYWSQSRPVDLRILSDSVEFSRENGKRATLDIRAIQRRINRMVVSVPHDIDRTISTPATR